MLRDVAVQDAVVDQVEGGQCLSVVLQQLTLVDEPHLLLLTCKIGPGRDKPESELHRVVQAHDVVSVCVCVSGMEQYLLCYQIVRYILFIHN